MLDSQRTDGTKGPGTDIDLSPITIINNVVLTVVVDENNARHAKHRGQQGADCGQRRGPAPERPPVTVLTTNAATAGTCTTATCRVIRLLLVRVFAVVPSVDRIRDDGTAAADTTATVTVTVGLAPHARAVRFREHHHLVIQIGVIAMRVNVTAATAVTVHAVRGHRLTPLLARSLLKC